MASAAPNCRAYDPAFGYEISIIADEGMRQMIEQQQDVFYYLTVTNGNYAQPSLANEKQVRDGVLKGMYLLDPSKRDAAQVCHAGIDCFGRSDTRAALREFFEIDRASIALAALKALVDEGSVDSAMLAEAGSKYHKDASDRVEPWLR